MIATCKVCCRRIWPGQKTIQWHGNRCHKTCVVYSPKSG